MLYLIVMTFFLCVVVWDTERVGRKKGECCGACICSNQNPLCCRGYFLTPKQIRYGTSKPADQVEQAVEQVQGETSQEASKTEKCIDKYLAPKLLTTPGRIALLVIYAILIQFSIYGCWKVRIDFKVTYFIGETAQVYGFFQENDKYFSTGSFTTIYVDNSEIDFTSAAAQRQIQALNKALVDCPECDENWHVEGTLTSWYDSLHTWTKKGGCAPTVAASNAVDYTIPAEHFNTCLTKFLTSDAGRRFEQDLIYTGTIGAADFKMTAFR